MKTRFALCTLAVVLSSTTVLAQTTTPGRVGVSVEGLMVWQQRNDVRIPPKTGSKDDAEVLAHLTDNLKRVVYGQDAAIDALTDKLDRLVKKHKEKKHDHHAAEVVHVRGPPPRKIQCLSAM